MRFRVLASGLASLLISSAALSEPQIFRDEDGVTRFSTPTGNIGCTYIPAGGTGVYYPKNGGPELQCDRVEPVYLRFFLYKSGKAEKFTNVGDIGCCSADNILVYGNSWSKGPFRCTSARNGLTCTRGKAGFFISRGKTSVY